VTSQREQRQVFGEVAEAYDDVRPDYPTEVAERILAYAGQVPAQAVESGAGTGKGTEILRRLGVPLTCVEPDPAMAAVLTRRFRGDELVSVVVSRFEDWIPPEHGVELLASAQAWHWVDYERRTELAHAALASDGVIAIFAHHYGFADGEMADALNAAYLRQAPEIAEKPGRHAHHSHHSGAFHPDELRESPLFIDFAEHRVSAVVPFLTARYLELLRTFSPHRMLPDDQRERLHEALAGVIDERGGVLEQQLTTAVWLARKAR
jgi:hypothetical protein